MNDEFDWEIAGARLRRRIEAAGSKAALAAKAGMPVTTLQSMLKGNVVPGIDKVIRVADALGMSLQEVVYGIGPESGDQGTADQSDFIDVPLFDAQASAGPGATNGDVVPVTAIKFRADWLSRRRLNTDNLHAIRVRGDSMEPTLKNGDLIVVDTENKVPVDGVYVIGFDGETQVKRLQRLSPTRLVIASDNPLAGTTEIDLRDESQHPRIIGRVIWLGRDL